MPGIIIQIPQLDETLILKQSTYPSLDGSSTIQNLKNIINTNEHFDHLRLFAEFADGINYTLKNEKNNTLITQDNATLSDLGLDVNGDQWPKIILRILPPTTAAATAATTAATAATTAATAATTAAVGGRKRSTRRRRSKRRSRRKKRTKRRRSSRHRRSKKRRTRRGGKGRKGKCLVGQRRNRAGKITKSGHYKKC